jgi:hypothetical protein
MKHSTTWEAPIAKKYPALYENQRFIIMVGFEVLTAVITKMAVSWVVAP